jgi:hypothetical protein
VTTATSTPNAQPVRILCTSKETPVMLDGSLTESGDTTHTVSTSAAAATLGIGDRVILDFTASSRARITGSVQRLNPSSDGGYLIEIADSVDRERDKRDFPRLCAGVPIRYRVVSDDDLNVDAAALESWVDSSDAGGGEWHSPDPFMNFSVGGLRFDGLASLREGATLLVDLAIDDSGERWATTAKVIRVWDPETAGADTRSVAVAFEHLPEGAREALSDLTLRIQDSLL